jgi:hypothetical protein
VPVVSTSPLRDAHRNLHYAAGWFAAAFDIKVSRIADDLADRPFVFKYRVT